MGRRVKFLFLVERFQVIVNRQLRWKRYYAKTEKFQAVQKAYDAFGVEAES
ncbi:hypothetical protein Cflav_PD4697 [Pedosphaera parvula Ellin514]|uniref:Uncharacterized protein n=1 Tax=Pedosphaera parvula (strain Ellin514) TaxID=320771 RepID=B9XEE3_PEDPL|nr:hypothetical protein Cflav_PD4697 [Pedosphaera parvula Ellin514]